MRRKVNAARLARWFAPRPVEALVDKAFACPKCGERRMGRVANYDGDITCQTCGKRYEV